VGRGFRKAVDNFLNAQTIFLSDLDGHVLFPLEENRRGAEKGQPTRAKIAAWVLDTCNCDRQGLHEI
jgi:hypothetical protein